jgi:hypothetical protein
MQWYAHAQHGWLMGVGCVVALSAGGVGAPLSGGLDAPCRRSAFIRATQLSPEDEPNRETTGARSQSLARAHRRRTITATTPPLDEVDRRRYHDQAGTTERRARHTRARPNRRAATNETTGTSEHDGGRGTRIEGKRRGSAANLSRSANHEIQPIEMEERTFMRVLALSERHTDISRDRECILRIHEGNERVV